MPDTKSWSVPRDLQPEPRDLAFDFAAALDAIVMLHAEIPEDGFTASMLGTERIGNGVVIRDDGLILTIGYLVTEAESIWITANDGTVVAGYPLAYDFASGLGLVQPLGRLRATALARGSVAEVEPGDEVIVLGHGGQAHALAAHIFAKREFAGYWEYVLDEALFTTPPHPQWSGAALVSSDGRLIGIGSLFVQEAHDGEAIKGNMFVPVDLLAPILDDMLKSGRPGGRPRPWLGMYTGDEHGRLVVNGVAEGGPAARVGIRPGDIVTAVAGERVGGLAELFRAIWRQGPAGTPIPLTLARDGTPIQVEVDSRDRSDFLRKPRLQ
jgi:S1-C subfamily serine protease